MSRSLGLVTLAVCASLAVAEDSPRFPASLLDSSHDRVVDARAVPDESRRVGEVRLVARGKEAMVVQTLLSTKILSRVVGEIGKKEEANWPAGVAGHADMTRYVGALEAAQRDVRAHPPKTPRTDRSQRLLIEFVAGAGGAGVFVAEFAWAEAGGGRRPAAGRALATLALSRAYVARNMRLILADAFGVPEAEVDRLGPLPEIVPDDGPPPLR